MRRVKLLSLLIICSLALAGGLAVSPVRAQDPVRITYVVNGTLGDKSFFDSGQRGLDKVADEYGAEVNTIELGSDQTVWETGLVDAMSATDDYDMLIVGTFQMVGYLSKNADKYPDKTFIFFDADLFSPDTLEGCAELQMQCKNVYTITYKQNEGSFLAGIYAGAMTTTDLEGMNPDAVIGAVGGLDIPVINDFIVGYQQGACLVNKDSQFLVQYVGGNTPFFDPAKGKEIALSMYQQKADIVFQVAGNSGDGVFEAAQEQSKYALGVDSDQATIIAENDPDQAARILTSMQKNVDNSLVRAFELYQDGKLPVGTNDALGLQAGGVSLSINDIYTAATPENIQKLVEAATAAVSDGTVSVVTVFAAEADAAKVGADCSGVAESTFDASEFLK